jgi:glucan-binding YG repeat protein
MDMDVNVADVQQMAIENVQAELTVEDLELMEEEEAEEEDDEEAPAHLPSAEVKSFLKDWEKTMVYFKKNHPLKMEVELAVGELDDYADHFRTMMRGRGKQSTIDQFFAPGVARRAAAPAPAAVEVAPAADEAPADEEEVEAPADEEDDEAPADEEDDVAPADVE